jgi:uncharacterized protein
MSTALIKPVGDRCNLRCRYCFYRPGTGGAGAVMDEHVLRAMTQAFLASGDSPVVFAWQGGEPTLAGLGFYRAALANQKRFARPGQAVANAFQTNGLLIDDAWAEFLASNRFLVGLSIDGPADVHDAARQSAAGAPSHHLAVRAWRLLRERQCEVNVLCVVHDANCTGAREVYRYLTDELSAAYLQFIPCIPPLAVDEQADRLPVGAYGRFLTEVFECWAAERSRSISVKLFDDLVLFLAGKPMRDCMFRATCDSHLVVERDGSVYPCDFFVSEQHRLGSIPRQPLSEIRERTAQFRDRKQRERPQACRDCRHLDICQGGCPRFWQADSAGVWRQARCEDIRSFLDHCRGRLEEMARAVQARWHQDPGTGHAPTAA